VLKNKKSGLFSPLSAAKEQRKSLFCFMPQAAKQEQRNAM
jgi:hypothetical protein